VTADTHRPGNRSGALQEFLRLESAGGIVLMGATVIALLVANSPLAGYYDRLLDTYLRIGAGDFSIRKPLLLWINDGLMAAFFFLVGLELKREMLEGHLATLRQAALPGIAALGGMGLPAACFAAFNWGDAEAMRGWAIPTATDIAFALGVLSLLGSRVPPGLKAFLLSVAIFDDVGAIAIIALFYTDGISALALQIATVAIIVLAVLNRAGVRQPLAYLGVGLVLWVAVLKSGVHATLAGVMLALFIPLRTPAPTVAPLRRLEHALHPWVAFGVLPIFALANAGVSIAAVRAEDFFHPVLLGIVTGLVVGKLVGVLLASWLAVSTGLAALPDGVSWRQIFGVALLCGVGFTMSLFIASLAYEQGSTAFYGLEKLGILTGSLVSGVLGYAVLQATLGRAGESGTAR
jgi:NhaA family Na+:H+ antiporter